MGTEPLAAAAPRTVVRFDDVHMVFSSGWRAPVQALHGFSLDVPEGAVVGVLGPNGSGKTTAISCLLRLLRPQSGAVYLWGERVEGDLPDDREKRIGVL